MCTRIIIACVLLVGAVSGAVAAAYQWQLLSKTDAIAVASSFRGISPASVTVLSEPHDGGMSPNASASYELQDDRYDYEVCEYSQDVFVAYDKAFVFDRAGFYGRPADVAALKSLAKSEEQTRTIAVSFMKAHYPVPATLTEISVTAHVIQDDSDPNVTVIDYYDYRFRPRNASFVGPSVCDLEVDAVKGEIVDYVATYYPVLIGTIPQFTREQAFASAAASLGVRNASVDGKPDLIVRPPDAFGVELLLYDFLVAGAAPGGSGKARYRVTVDANSGIVVSAAELHNGVKGRRAARGSKERQTMPAAATQNQSRPKRLNFIMNGQPAYLAVPPILVSDKPYMAALYLECSTIPYRVHGDTDWLDISTHNGHARLTAQTKSVEIGSAKFTVGAPPVVYEGRWYLPLDLFGRLSGADVQFNAADSCVTYGGRVPLREYRN